MEGKKVQQSLSIQFNLALFIQRLLPSRSSPDPLNPMFDPETSISGKEKSYFNRKNPWAR